MFLSRGLKFAVSIALVLGTLAYAPGLRAQNGSPQSKGPVNVAGTWQGSVVDVKRGLGSIDFVLTQTKRTVGGTWDFSAGDLQAAGSVVKGRASRKKVRFTLRSESPSNCAINVIAQLESDTHMIGRYAGVSPNCQAFGNLDLTKPSE